MSKEENKPTNLEALREKLNGNSETPETAATEESETEQNKIITPDTLAETAEEFSSDVRSQQAPIESPKVPEVMYQHYNCSRRSTRLITPEGKPVVFRNFHFMTDDTDIIRYLDKELKSSLVGVITKGELLSATDSDPVLAYKKKIIEEYLAEQAAEQNAAKAALKNGTGMMNSQQVTMAAGSMTADQ